MVSYTDLLPAKQPRAPVAADLNDPQPQQKNPSTKPKPRRSTRGGHSSGRRRRQSSQVSAEEWQRSWDLLHNKILYFRGVTEDALPELQRLFKACRGIRLNVDPHESLDIAGNVEFRNVYDAEKAMAILNNRKLKETKGILVMTPLADRGEIGAPPGAGYVCIKHIPEDTTESSLYDLLRPSGTLYSCSIPTAHPGKTARRDVTAYACFSELAYAEAAILQLNFTEYNGNIISMQLVQQPLRHARSRTMSGGDGGDSGANGEVQEPSTANRDEKPNGNGTATTTPTPTPTPTPSAPVSARHSGQQQQQQQQLPQRRSSSRRAASPGSSAADGPGGGLGGVIVPGKLFVTNLHPTVSHKELFALFKKYGYIQSARVSIDPTSKKSRGHGIVQFSDPNAGIEALRECQGADIKGRKITLYQYEHVNRQTALGNGGHAGETEIEPVSESNSSNSGSVPPPAAAAAAAAHVEPESELVPEPCSEEDSLPGTIPFPRSDSVSSSRQSDPLLDTAMLRSLSDASRSEIITQKLVAAAAANPEVDALDAGRMVASFAQRPLEDVVAMLGDPALLASEWEHEQRANAHLPQLMQALGVDATDADADADADQLRKERSGGGIHLRDYDTETEEFIEMLLSKPEGVRKMKLGSKLFPMVKGMGYSESTKLTVWILDHLGQDVRMLAYMLNDTARLREIVDQAQRAIGASR
ncbi:hypothetical protein LPJ72_002014 [Coemansia sp. Benny D160-2]|nr:hypothetical protein LPJ72_002014 [Coemansia sp. Benny D160-2]